MPYSSPSDIQKRISPEILLQLAASPAALITDSAVLAVIQGWCDAADQTIDGWIQTRYITPVIGPAEQLLRLQNWSADIACYNAYSYRGVTDAENPWKARHDQITSKNEGILMNIKAGTMNLVGVAEQTGRRLDRSAVRAGFDSERSHFNPPQLWGGAGCFLDDDYRSSGD